MDKLNSFLNYYKIPSSLRSDVYSYYGHILDKNFTEDDFQILNSLPNSLKEELTLFMKIKLINKIDIFDGISHKCLKRVASKLKQKDYAPEALIIKKGDVGKEMFIIAHGSVEVISNEHVIAKLQEGQFFGELALMEETLRVANVKTSVYCDLYTLSKTDFLEITQEFPELRKRFEVIYKKITGENLRVA